MEKSLRLNRYNFSFLTYTVTEPYITSLRLPKGICETGGVGFFFQLHNQFSRRKPIYLDDLPKGPPPLSR